MVLYCLLCRSFKRSSSPVPLFLISDAKSSPAITPESADVVFCSSGDFNPKNVHFPGMCYVASAVSHCFKHHRLFFFCSANSDLDHLIGGVAHIQSVGFLRSSDQLVFFSRLMTFQHVGASPSPVHAEYYNAVFPSVLYFFAHRLLAHLTNFKRYLPSV